VLARNLARHANDPPAAFAAFETERYPRTTAIANEAWRFGKVLQLEGTLAVWLRDFMSGIMIQLTGMNNLAKHARFDVGPLAAIEK
jgi:2-polyprenyl-6-methoxyphenol hydroxylase-like FAD-dependent oxidoreductase